MKRYSEEMRIWLFDLAHGNLTEEQIVSGFIRYYLFYDGTFTDVKRDMVFHTCYGDECVRRALESLTGAFDDLVRG